MRRIHLRAARERKGWTQEQLSEVSGVSQAAISNLETKQTGASFDTVVDLAIALGVDPRALKFGPTDKREAVHS